MSNAPPSPNHPSGNDSLPDEYGVPKVPCTDLGDSPSAQSAAAADSVSGSRSAIEGAHDNGSLEARGAGLGVAVVANASVPVYSGGLMVTSVRSSQCTTSTPLGPVYAIEVPPNPVREYQAQQRFTLPAAERSRRPANAATRRSTDRSLPRHSAAVSLLARRVAWVQAYAPPTLSR
jgi:hypothetical protein